MLVNYWKFLFLSLVLFNLMVNGINCIKWNYKYADTIATSTSSSSLSQLTINCNNADQIWIGWSHYGTRVSPILSENVQQSIIQDGDFTSLNIILNENDCWMNFTEKIAEQCNGASECDISSQPTYIHKCGKISDYIFVSYVCYKAENTHDICKRVNIEKTKLNDDQLLISSPDFPNEYEPSIDCTCVINTNNPIKFDILWFSLQDNDFLNIKDYKNLTGWLTPTTELTILNNKSLNLRFKTDDALSYKGFWMKITENKACKDDWQLVGDSCVKVFSELLDWRSANQRCQSMNGYLIKIDDVINDLKLSQYIKVYYPEITSYWIGLRKYVDETNKEKWMWSNKNSTTYNDVSWWPWKRGYDTSNGNNVGNQRQNCVIKRKNEDGFLTVPCDTTASRNSFICQTDNSYYITNTKVNMQCGETDYINQVIEMQYKAKLSSQTTLQSKIDLLINNQKPLDLILSNKNENQNRLIDLNKFLTTKSFNDKQSTLNGESNKVSIDEQHQQFLTTLLQQRELERNLLFATTNSNVGDVSSTVKNESKFSTMIAGILSGVGLVILIVNVLVLVICRRNLKKLIKNAKQQSQSSSSSSSSSSTTSTKNDDLTQEYFESFAQTIPSLTLYNQQPQLITTSTLRPFLINNKQHLNCMFKPICANDTDVNVQGTLHQYDKMNHQLTKLIQMNSKSSDNDQQQQQQQHTYESVDTLELPSAKRNVHLGISSRSYKNSDTISTPKLNSKQILFNNINLIRASQNSNDLVFNSTSASTSTTSSSSSTNQFIRHFNKQQQQQQGTATLILPSHHTNAGSWSPDSAYYSSIPNYGYNTLTQTQQQLNQQQQQQQQSKNNFNNFQPQSQFRFFNTNEHLINENLRSQLV